MRLVRSIIAASILAAAIGGTTAADAKPAPRSHHAAKTPKPHAAPRIATARRQAPRHAATRHATIRHVATRKVAVRHAAATSGHRVATLLTAARKHRLLELARPLIIIDPGHGGRDSGAVGATGLREKDVALATALELRGALRAVGRYRVELTRTADTDLSLSSRVGRAWSERPALFISIHADASPDRTARGASVYVRNEALAGGTVTKLPATPAASGAIGQALSTGSPRPSAGSAALQLAIVEQLRDDVAMVHDPAREAHLFVLGAVGVPGVLVEVGFVSNQHEERLLRTRRYRQTVAYALRDAIGDYFGKTTFAVADGS